MTFQSAVKCLCIAALLATTAACNTVQGLGRDLESVGRKGEDIIT